MASAVEVAVDTYIRACSERDPAIRARLIEECFAVDGRIVARSREIRGRRALADFLGGFLADPRLLRIRLMSEIDARGTTFRYRAVADFRDGTSAESFDAGEIDARGRISVILTFAGALREASETTRSLAG